MPDNVSVRSRHNYNNKSIENLTKATTKDTSKRCSVPGLAPSVGQLFIFDNEIFTF